MNIFQRYIEKFNEKRRFTAQNCLNSQNNKKKNILETAFKEKVDQITSRINFVVSNELDEHQVIYHIPEDQKKFFESVGEHFKNIGFDVRFGTIPWISDSEEYMVILWV